MMEAIPRFSGLPGGARYITGIPLPLSFCLSRSDAAKSLMPSPYPSSHPTLTGSHEHTVSPVPLTV